MNENKTIKFAMESKIIDLFLNKVITAFSRDILLTQLHEFNIEDPNFETMKYMLKDKKIMSHYNDFINSLKVD